MATPDTESFGYIWSKLPFITRNVTAITGFMFILVYLLPHTLIYTWFIPSYALYYPWTIVTSAFACRGQPPQVLMNIAFNWINLRSLEEGQWRRSELILLLAFMQALCLVIGPKLGIYAYFDIISSGITYTLAQQNPRAPSKLLYVIDVPLGILPWANALLGALFSGVHSMIPSLLGIFLGHLHLYLTVLLPNARGPRLLTVPQWLKKWDADSTAAQGGSILGNSHHPSNSATFTAPGSRGVDEKRFGKGHRLGS